MKNDSFLASLKIAIRSLFEAAATERNFRIQLAIAVAVIVAGLILGLTTIEWIVIAICIGGVLSAELINTAIESVVDLLQPEIDERARRAKDFAAGSVLVVSITAAVVGLLVFSRHLHEWLESGI
ncbi:Undecaprenol kinase [Thalassoglobus neptunius]|uniref:Undecaprenol kinase n=1 Tax=Thalassoglobus neptunius TaxID=1938619 RepID=A0A5C5WGS2_9PLAN|nr:diacylglycerol kinase family protein [Thalassoglobus neptunius]TWT49978.1 Undecaprenol kinase [Thalassoglobus neptunius]